MYVFPLYSGYCPMNRRALLISVASLGLFGSSAVLARSATVENIRTPIPFTQNLSLEKVREAVIRGGLAKGWQVVGEKNQTITLKYVKKIHIAACDVHYSTKEFSITINPMTTLISGPNKVHPKYNQWVRNLNKHILAQLSALSLGVKP